MGDFPKNVGTSWNERMRLIRFRRKREKFRFWDEFKVVPRWLVGTMITLYVIALITVITANALTSGAMAPYDIRNKHALIPFALAGIVTAVAIFVSSILFLIGYVYRDAKRRGMSAGAWTFLVIALMPAYFALGFIVYFVMREPLPFDCPQCGTKVGARFNYCPNCKYNLHPSCPQCKREVLDSDRFCSFCGQSLTDHPAGEPPAGLVEHR
jgi:double zinc ribbon protein